MRGIHQFDENVDRFQVGLRSKKWWIPLFAFGIDTACQNAWHLVENSDADKDVTHCQFQRAIVEIYCGLFGQPSKKEGSNAPMGTPVPPEVRQNPEQHAGVDCSERRCQLCHQRKSVKCQKGWVGLHIHCCYKFHTQKGDTHKEKSR
jgi:hypothetical protein